MKYDKPVQILLDQIRSILNQARQQAATAVNFVMVSAYWEIGQRIVDEVQKGSEKAEYDLRIIQDQCLNIRAEQFQALAKSGIFSDLIK